MLSTPTCTEENLPVHNAIRKGDLKYIPTLLESVEETMIKRGYDSSQQKEAMRRGINSINDQGMTPLHLFAQYYSDDPSSLWVAELLLDKGADINALDKLGNTALHTCVDVYFKLIDSHKGAELIIGTKLPAENHFEKVEPFLRFLIDRGCDTTIQNHMGETALRTLAKYGGMDFTERSDVMIAECTTTRLSMETLDNLDKAITRFEKKIQSREKKDKCIIM